MVIRASWRTARFLLRWLAGRGTVHEEEIEMASGEARSASLYRPATRRRDLPAWIVLHGITRPGRRHPALVRFARALAASGAAVLVPEIRRWRALELAPDAAGLVLRQSLRTLAERPETADRPPGTVGFSFGAPQAVLAAAREDLRGRLGAVVGFGGYCDLERTVRFQFTGVHGWKGRRDRLRPDPYGRWVIGANVLPWTTTHRDAADVARGLHRLAAEAGDLQRKAWHPSFDPLKREIRRTVASSRRELFDLFAPPSNREPDRAGVDEIVGELVRCARRRQPLLDPAPLLRPPPCPVHLIHGRDDRLIPFTETLRTEAALSSGGRTRATVTRLFAHSGGSSGWGVRLPAEAWRFGRALAGVLGSV